MARRVKEGAQNSVPTHGFITSSSHFSPAIKHLSWTEKSLKHGTLQHSPMAFHMSQGKLCNYTLSKLLLWQ